MAPTLKNPGTGEGRQEPVFLENTGFSKDLNDVDRVLLSQGAVMDRIEKLALDLANYYEDEEFHVVCVLKGSRLFFSHLFSALNKIYTYKKTSSTRPPFMDHYIRLKSYDGMESSFKLRVIGEDLEDLAGKNVVIVEDIIDTGHTLTEFVKMCQDVKAKSIGVLALTEKRTPKSNGFKGDWVGFSIPNEFIVGYFRDLEHICIMAPAGIERFSAENLNRLAAEGLHLGDQDDTPAVIDKPGFKKCCF